MLTKTLKGKRLINSFGALRGVEVPEELTDDDLDDDLPLHADALHIPQRVRLQFFRAMDRGLIMKYYIKSAKGYWLAQGHGYTKPKRSLCFHSRPNVAVCFNLTAARSSDSPKHSRGTHYTLLCKVVRSYKTITPKTPQTPQSSMGVFFFPL